MGAVIRPELRMVEAGLSARLTPRKLITKGPERSLANAAFEDKQDEETGQSPHAVRVGAQHVLHSFDKES